jgi:SAM-dependent methyltransferase
VHREPFAPELFDDPFDLIVHHGVLEHVPDPVSFMSGQLSLLAPGGAIAFSVPDCATALAHGDISILVHEHWSYLTERTLEAVAALGGARVVSSEPAGVAGARHSVWARADGPLGPASPPPDPRSFVARAAGNLERIRDHLRDLRERGARVGIFCPGRFINYESLLADSLPPLRYFDDDPLLAGLFYPPSRVQIEPRAGLLADPPTHLIIVSWTFGAEILRSLRSERSLDHVDIQTIADLLPA